MSSHSCSTDVHGQKIGKRQVTGHEHRQEGFLYYSSITVPTDLITSILEFGSSQSLAESETSLSILEHLDTFIQRRSTLSLNRLASQQMLRVDIVIQSSCRTTRPVCDDCRPNHVRYQGNQQRHPFAVLWGAVGSHRQESVG
jgi:hypothetical protein